jgi:hypothetical protein
VARQAGRAAGLAGLVLVGIPGALTLGLLAFLAMLQNDNELAVDWVLALAALPFGCLTFGLLAFFGGYVIDFARRRALSPVVSTALIGAVLFDCIGVYLVGWNWLYLVVFDNLRNFDKVAMINTGSTAMAGIGWALGLLVSGFPEVLRLCRGFTLPARRAPKRPASRPRAAPSGP